MIFPGHPLSDTVLHQSRQTRQSIDGGIDTLRMHLAVEDDLSFGDIPGQVRDRVGDIIIGHGKDRQLCDGTAASDDLTAAFVQFGKIAVQIPGIPLSRRNLPSQRAYLSEGLAVVGHVGHDHQYLIPLVEGKVFCKGKSRAGCDSPLDRRVIGKREEEGNLIEDTALR